jgi:hypothetical protein
VLYDIVLFLHLITIAAAFFVAGALHVSLLRMRSAADISQARTASAQCAACARLLPIALLILLITGAYLTQVRWSWTTPWIDVAILGLLMMGAIGGGVLGRRERALHAFLSDHAGDSIDPATASRLQDRVLMIGSAVMPLIAIGVMLVMVTKPGLIAGILELIAATALGALIGVRMQARTRTADIVAAGG